MNPEFEKIISASYQVPDVKAITTLWKDRLVFMPALIFSGLSLLVGYAIASAENTTKQEDINYCAWATDVFRGAYSEEYCTLSEENKTVVYAIVNGFVDTEN